MKKTLTTAVAAVVFASSLLPATAFAWTFPSHPFQGPITRRDLNPRFGPVLLTHSTINSISGSTLSVSLNNISYTVNTTNTTAFFRRFFAPSFLAQFSVGDIVNVRGAWTDPSHTAINADFIRDTSIQERHDSFVGTVTGLNNSGFTLRSFSRGTLTVIVPSTARLVDRNGSTIFFSSIAVNDSVNLDGLWDRTHTSITATFVRDNSLPR